MEVSIFEVLFFLTLLVYTAPHIMVFGAVYVPPEGKIPVVGGWLWAELCQHVGVGHVYFMFIV